MYPVTDTTRQIVTEIVHERKHPDRAPPGRPRAVVVFVSLAEGMKNREVPRFELTRTARAAPICPPSFRSPVSINRLRGGAGWWRGWGENRKNRDPCFNKVAFTSFGGDC